MISGSNERLQKKLEYTLLKPACHSRGISKMQYDTLEKQYAIKFSFKLGKNATKTFFDYLAWIEHGFLSGIRNSREAGSLWGMLRGVGGIRKSILQSWLAKELGLGLEFLCWGFMGVEEEIPSEEANTLQIGSVAFPPGQYTSPQLHPCQQTIWPRWASRRYLSLPKVQTLLPVIFGYSIKLRGCCYVTIEKMKEAVTKVIDMLTQEDFRGAFQKLLER